MQVEGRGLTKYRGHRRGRGEVMLGWEKKSRRRRERVKHNILSRDFKG